MNQLETPVKEDEVLAGLTPGELIDLMIEHEDRVPRSVIDECARRGDQMLDALAPFARPDDEREAASPGHWWLRLHAVMILGLIPGEAAGRLLVEFARQMCRQEDENLQEWLSGYWPALLHNKPHSVIAPLRDICMDRRVDWFMRANLVDAIIEHAQQQGEAELEQALDWVAQLAADEEDDWEYRLSIANGLLDFPRERHRPLLTELAARQSGFGVHFSQSDINKAYAQGRDIPQWERYGDPWKFYDDRQIQARQQRWQEEDREYDIDEAARLAELDFYNQGTYQRESPKIGRNDPCPCGSGKKYKKCCLGKP